MAISGREKITIGAGAAVVVLAGLIKLAMMGLGSGGTAAADSVAGAIERMEQHKELKASVDKLVETLSVELPVVERPEQETLIRQKIAQTAQKNQLQISSLRRMESGSRRRSSATRPIQFRISVKGPFDGLVKYVHALEQSTTPFVIREMNVTPSLSKGNPGGPGGPPGSRGGKKQAPTGQVQATLRLQAHLFPEVMKAAKKEAAKTPTAQPESAPEPPQAPAPSGISGMPGMPGMPSAPAVATTPAVPETPTPAATGKIGRKTITIPGGPTIVIEGNTVTVNGKVEQVSVEEIEKGLSHLPPGATVVEE